MENNNNSVENTEVKNEVKTRLNLNQQQIAAAIVIAGVIIAGSILLKGSAPIANNAGSNNPALTAVPATAIGDQLLGDPKTKVTLVMYEDFQCPFCERFFTDSEKNIRDNYVNTGKINFLYRDFAFLGEESVLAAEAAKCASDQGRFWEYHDYLYGHQNGENAGAFLTPKLKGFATTVGLNAIVFNDCMDTGKYKEAVMTEKNEASLVGVNGTPKGFIIKNGKTVDSIDGAIPYADIKMKLDAAIK